jgi:hypothetical protein
MERSNRTMIRYHLRICQRLPDGRTVGRSRSAAASRLCNGSQRSSPLARMVSGSFPCEGETMLSAVCSGMPQNDGHIRDASRSPTSFIPRKEVIQPHLPIRLPCYDLVPLTASTFGASLLAVGTTTSGEDNSGGLTGGVYKAQEHIHRGVADPRLLAIPASSGRIAAHYPN